MRITRALRVARLFHVFRELRVLMESIFHILLPLMWSALLLAILIVMFSIIFCFATSTFLQDMPARSETTANLQRYFSSIDMACLSMFMSLTGGESWIHIITPLLKISGIYGILYVLCIVFLQLGVLNVVTSIFVTAADAFCKKDVQMIELNEQDWQTEVGERLSTFFDVFDLDKDGTLSLAEFEGFAEDRTVQAFFERMLNIQTWKVARFFHLLDVDKDERLRKDEFVVGCMQLTGPAKNIDLEALRLLCSKTKREVTHLKESVRKMNKDLIIMSRGMGVRGMSASTISRSSGGRSSDARPVPSRNSMNHVTA